MSSRRRPPEAAEPPSIEALTQRAFGVAYVFLNRRDRTVAEVRARLEREALPPGVIETAVAELVELGTVDDARFARLFAQDKRELEQWGQDRIARGLRQRGIDRELIADALTETDTETELDRAVELLRRRFPAAPSDQRERERAFGVLVRKGYDPELAGDALRAWAAG